MTEDLHQSSGFGKVLRFLCRLEFYDEALDQSSEFGPNFKECSKLSIFMTKLWVRVLVLSFINVGNFMTKIWIEL